MKKTYIYIMVLAAVAVAMLAISCVHELDIPRTVTGDQAMIRLTPVCVDPVTKADDDNTEPGDNTYNENKIDGYYWFVYRDEAGTDLVLSGYTSGNGATERPLDSNFPITAGNKGYVYVVANLPTKPESPADGDMWFEYIAPTSNNSSTAADPSTAGIKQVIQGGTPKTFRTAAELKTIEFGKGTPTTYTNSSEFYEYTSATTGVPKPERFVMRTEDLVDFEVEEHKSVEVSAHLSRVAVKIILDLFVAEEVEQTETQTDGQEKYIKTWYSDMSHIQIYMLWGSTHGKLTGEPVTYSSEHANWFYSASPRYAMYTEPVGGSFNGTDIDGSVPSSLYSETTCDVEYTVWEVVYEREWIWNADVPDEDKTLNNQDDEHGHWGDYILDENNEKIPVKVNGVVQRQPVVKTETRPYFKISSLPLYTMPISWNVNDAHAPFIKVILPWQGYNKETGVWDEKNGVRKPKEFYYKILIPELTTLDANNCYHIKLDLSVLGSEADEVPVELSGEYHVVGWNEPVAAMGGDQTAGRYLDCATHFEFYSQSEMNIPVRSSHNISVVLTGTNAPKTSYNIYTGDTQTPSTGQLNLSTTSSTGGNYTISTSGNNKVTVLHTLETNLDDMASRDVSPITYTFRIQHSDDANYFKDITVVQYPTMYIVNDPNSGWNNGTARGYVYVNGNRQATTIWNRVRPDATSATNNNFNMYVVTVSVLTGSSILGDPRGTNSITPGNPTWVSAPGVEGTASRTLSNKYREADNTAQAANMIAPKLRVASSWGAAGEYSFDNANRRCASYQEDGIPAGRWRLPTEAEVKFLVNLSAQGLIPRLFGSATGSSTYWSSTGTVTVNGDNVTTTTTTTGDNRTRCVYDEWYWGSTKNSDDIRATYRNTFTWGDEYSSN